MADIMAKTIKFPGLNNTYEFMQPDGSYPELSAGNIISNDAYNEDTEPYLFRALPYKSKRLEEDLVGAIVNWNQLVDTHKATETVNGITFTNNGDGSWTINGTATARAQMTFMTIPIVSGHKYLVVSNFSTVNANWRVIFQGEWITSSSIVNCVNTNNAMSFDVASGTTLSNVKSTPKLVDLTAFIGNATIADAIYAMEQATAGSGVAFMRKYFPDVFTADYDAGTLKSVNPTAHVTRGVNAWDEEWELGYLIPSNGQNATIQSDFRSKNYIPVVPNATYYILCPYTGTNRYALYDADKNFITSSNGWGIFSTKTVTMPSNAHYMRFYCTGTTYKNDICINISDPTINGKYFQYEEHTYDLGNVPLYGLFQLENGKLKAYGDVRHAEGGTDRKFTLADMGTLTWYAITTGGVQMFYAELPNGSKNDNVNVICEKYPSVTAQTDFLNSDKVVRGYGSTAYSFSRIGVRDSSYSDAATFKTAMSGVMLYYEKATPTTEDTPSFEKIQSCFPYGIEEYITTNGVPVGHDTKYFKDVISNIAGIPEPPSGNGTYELKLTVTNGVASYSWVAV